MEYIFGESTHQHADKLILRTKGTEHTQLTGTIEHLEEFADSIIRTSCRILEHISSAEDDEGNCYDWYEVDQYKQEINLSDTEREKLNTEIDSLVADCGELVQQLYESDLTYAIGV